jgi:hypothetical protein
MGEDNEGGLNWHLSCLDLVIVFFIFLGLLAVAGVIYLILRLIL